MGEDARIDLPDWWDWELAFTSHLEARMEERGFSEVELRTMLQKPLGIRAARQPGRWSVDTRFGEQRWVVVVEPDSEAQLLVVVTAYPTRL